MTPHQIRRSAAIRHWSLALAFAVTTGVGLLAPQPATAGIDACRNIHVEANAKCEVLVGAPCEAKCEPINFELSCAAELQAQCSAQCTNEVEVVCQETCTTACVPECTLDPGKFECKGQCELDCSGKCEAHCESNPNKSQCKACCSAECSAQCTGGCEVEQPQLECTEKCTQVCGSSCKAQANVDCQVQCQSSLVAQCQSELSGGCKVECQQPQGSVFCDGQYIDHGGNLETCVDALNAYLTTKVEVHGDVDAECEGNECHADANAGVSCALTQDPSPWRWGWALLPAVAFFRRRKANHRVD